jgi:tRNA threonylcarbamoyladenosine biosynthesis protein TsaE
VPVGREMPLGDDSRHRLQHDLARRLVHADVRHLLGEGTEQREACGDGRLTVCVVRPTEFDDEHAVLVDSSVDDVHRDLVGQAAYVRQEVGLRLLRDPTWLGHRFEQGSCVRQQAGGVRHALSTLVDVPARAHGGQTIGVEIETSSAEETEAVGARIAAGLRPGDLVTVSGDLGTGKTTFVRGACRALGVEGPITSPTFTVGHRYRGHVDVSHLDLYRFSGVSPAEWGDLEPYFDDAVCFVEWPEAGDGLLPKARFAVLLEHEDETRRRIAIREC